MSFFDKIFDFFRHDDLGAKVVSIFLAIGLWYYVMTEQNPISERIVEVKLDKINQSDEYYVAGIPEKIAVTVRGPRINLNSNLEEKITAKVNLKNIKPGQQTLPISVKSRLGQVLSYTPSEINAYADTYGEKKVSVIARSVGKALDDMALGSCTIEPNEVVVRGPSRRLDTINRVIARVDISGQSESFQSNCDLVAVNDYGTDVPNMRITPGMVKVSASMVHQMHSLEIPVVPLISGELPEGIKVSKIEVVPSSIRVTAPPSIASSLKEIQTKTLDVSKLTGSQEFACELDLHEKVLPETRTVRVRISVESVKPKKEKHEAKN